MEYKENTNYRGKVVILKSGSIKMVVENLTGFNDVHCIYYYDGRIVKCIIDRECLEEVKEVD